VDQELARGEKMNTGLNFEYWFIQILALVIFYSGIRLYLNLIRRSNPKFFYSNVIISWVLISLFPVVLLFSVFQDSSLTGEITGTSFGTITVGGAFGAFFVLWIMGTRYSFQAIKEDHNIEKIKTLNEKIAGLEQQFIMLNAKPKDTRVISESSKIGYEFTYNKKRRTLGLVTGDIQQVRDIDLWVNSENTNLQMARLYDPSISGLIRYLGAKKDKEGNVIEDIIANALMDCVKEEKIEGGTNKNDFPSVTPGLAFTTTSGELKNTHKVQGIIHVTTVFGEIGRGYSPIKNLGVCVQNALSQADKFASDNKIKKVSIIFPLFGTGTAKGDLDLVARSLFYSVLAYYETRQDSKVDSVYFLTWKEYEKETCMNVLDDIQILTPKEPS
jgi:hypothetical protein